MQIYKSGRLATGCDPGCGKSPHRANRLRMEADLHRGVRPGKPRRCGMIRLRGYRSSPGKVQLNLPPISVLEWHPSALVQRCDNRKCSDFVRSHTVHPTRYVLSSPRDLRLAAQGAVDQLRQSNLVWAAARPRAPFSHLFGDNFRARRPEQLRNSAVATFCSRVHIIAVEPFYNRLVKCKTRGEI